MSDDGRSLGAGTRAALLLVHGFNGDPDDMRELEEHLAAQGFATRNLLLPGHGTKPRDLAHATWADWSGAVREATAELLESGLPVVVVGHSMGAALALHEAASNPGVSAVAALCPPLRMHPGEVRAAAVSRFVVPFLPTLWEDVYDRETRRRSARRWYRWTSVAAAHSLFCALPALRAELRSIRCPTLVVTARHDHVVPMRDGIEAYRLVGSDAKELVVLERSYHVVTKDIERDQVFEHVLQLAWRATRPPNHERQKGALSAALPSHGMREQSAHSDSLTTAIGQRNVRLWRRLSLVVSVWLADLLGGRIGALRPRSHGIL
jgi:carboxylesterase